MKSCPHFLGLEEEDIVLFHLVYCVIELLEADSNFYHQKMGCLLLSSLWNISMLYRISCLCKCGRSDSLLRGLVISMWPCESVCEVRCFFLLQLVKRAQVSKSLTILVHSAWSLSALSSLLYRRLSAIAGRRHLSFMISVIGGVVHICSIGWWSVWFTDMV